MQFSRTSHSPVSRVTRRKFNFFKVYKKLKKHETSQFSTTEVYVCTSFTVMGMRHRHVRPRITTHKYNNAFLRFRNVSSDFLTVFFKFDVVSVGLYTPSANCAAIVDTRSTFVMFFKKFLSSNVLNLWRSVCRRSEVDISYTVENLYSAKIFRSLCARSSTAYITR